MHNKAHGSRSLSLECRDAAAVKKKGTTQVNIMSFFGKK
jgi:hypothetical protein